jgi:molecular chaperone GrpE
MANKNKNAKGSPGEPDKARNNQNNENGEDRQEPVVRDKRRVDPNTGEVRHPDADAAEATSVADAADPADAAGSPGDAPAASGDTDSFTEEDLAFLTDLGGTGISAPESNLATERLADLQRLQAEYVNYRKRVERDRAAVRELAIAEVVKSLLPVLDDLDRAHAHGDLEGTPLDLVAQKLRASFERYGLTAVGAKGDVFDHNLHEAIYQQPSPDVTVNTVADVIESGYLLGERLLRPAKVAVDVPAE